MIGDLTLFPDCPVPKCTNPVDDDQPCAECSEMIDEGFIREVPVALPPMTVDEAWRELEARRLLAEAGRGEQARPNQLCWCCEERHTCRRDPEFPYEVKWICVKCEAIQ